MAGVAGLGATLPTGADEKSGENDQDQSLGHHECHCAGHAESTNSRIQRIKSRACGFRNRERFRNAIYCHCGGLDFLPEGVEGKWLPT